MASKVKFDGTGLGTKEGEIHFNVSFGSDYTLCGLTLDGDEETAGGFSETNEKVNCATCISLVEYCKGVRKSEMDIENIIC